MKYYSPYLPLFDNGDPEGQALRQAEADRINATTNRVFDTDDIIGPFTQLLWRNKAVPSSVVRKRS